MDKVIKSFNSFEETELDDILYYANLNPDKKIIELEIIRENYLNSINVKPEERRLQRVFEAADRE